MNVLISAGFAEGHALPALALARALVARDHEVVVELSERWRPTVEELGAGFAAGREYERFPAVAGARGKPPLTEVAVELASLLRRHRPDLVVADFSSPASALAAELARVKLATLIPTVYPVQGRGLPPFLAGLLAPRSAAGALAWRLTGPLARSLRPSTRWIARTPALIDGSRAELGLPPIEAEGRPLTTFGPLSPGLTLVATFPALEYPRRWPADVHVTGPMSFDLPEPEVGLPSGDDPLVVIAPSTVHDRDHRLVEMALAALAGERVRVLATLNHRGARWAGATPANAAVTDWASYAQVMAPASLAICTGGQGTVARALAAGTPALVCPLDADNAENGARVTWAGAGLMVPRLLLSPRTLRAAVRRLLGDRGFAARAAAIAGAGDGAERGAQLLERYATGATAPR